MIDSMLGGVEEVADDALWQPVVDFVDGGIRPLGVCGVSAEVFGCCDASCGVNVFSRNNTDQSEHVFEEGVSREPSNKI